MKHIKKFENFNNNIKEELDISTYTRAAEKLRGKGHNSRADVLDAHAKENIQPAEVTIDNQIELVFPENIKLYSIEKDWLGIWITIKEEDIDDEIGINIDFIKKGDDWEIEVSGLILRDRKNARSIHRLITQWAKIQNNEILKDNIHKLTVNDLYESLI